MVKFVKWLDSVDQVRRVTLLNGTDYVLMEEAVARVKEVLGASCGFAHLSAYELPSRDIWELASQNSFDGSRLIIVRDAELMDDWSIVESWMDSFRLNSNYLIFTSYGDTDSCDTALVAMLRRRTLSVVVECKITGEVDLVKWIQSKVKSDVPTARYLVAKSGGDVLKISNLCFKISLINSRLTSEAIDSLIVEAPKDSFVDSLVMLDKKSALLALVGLKYDDYPRIIAQLSARLDAVGRQRRVHHLSWQIK